MSYENTCYNTQKKDQALVIDFLSRTAEVLFKNGVISEKLIHEFRLSLREYTPISTAESSTSESHSLLIRLMSQQSEFLIAIFGRFGELSLFTNLLRYSIQQPMAQLQTDLHGVGQEILKKSDLIFNRSIYLFRNQNCEAQILASTLLLEIAEELAEASQAIGRTRLKMQQIVSCQLHFRRTLDDDIDQLLAQALGFNGSRFETLTFRSENQVLLDLEHVLTRVINTLRQALDQIRRNDKKQSILPIVSRLDRLMAETQKLKSLPMQADDDLLMWESRRLLWLESLEQMHQHLLGLGREIGKILKSSSFHQEDENYPIPASMQRRLVGDMVAVGLNPKDAKSASQALVVYCEQRNLRPGRLVSAELKKIHPLLSEQSLKLLQEMDIDRSLAKQSSQEKAWILDRSAHLMATFKASIGMLLILMALIPGCGLKTQPVSQIEDFRPEIPYKEGVKEERKKKDMQDVDAVPDAAEGSPPTDNR
ncbi:MAG: hypothetical protein ACOH5I_05350 [Oligoflexus sp.]